MIAGTAPDRIAQIVKIVKRIAIHFKVTFRILKGDKTCIRN